LKEYLKAALAGVGCTPMLAASLLVIGASIKQFSSIHLLHPPYWLLFPAGVFPLCLALYLRAIVNQHVNPDWLELWRRSQLEAADDRRPSVENFWIQTQVQGTAGDHFGKRLLDNAKWWGGCALVSGLCLAYICIWLGWVSAAGR
jgi:hypothetical protein